MDQHLLRGMACVFCLWAAFDPARADTAQQVFSGQRGRTADAADFHVSPQGNDAWSGRFPEPNAGGTDGPFASLERARDVVCARQAETGGGTLNPYTLPALQMLDIRHSQRTCAQRKRLGVRRGQSLWLGCGCWILTTAVKGTHANRRRHAAAASYWPAIPGSSLRSPPATRLARVESLGPGWWRLMRFDDVCGNFAGILVPVSASVAA